MIDIIMCLYMYTSFCMHTYTHTNLCLGRGPTHWYVVLLNKGLKCVIIHLLACTWPLSMKKRLTPTMCLYAYTSYCMHTYTHTNMCLGRGPTHWYEVLLNKGLKC